MNLWRAIPGLLPALAMLAAHATGAAAEPRRLALVIGNSLYTAMPVVEACGGSANVVAAALKRAGFAVTQLANTSNGQMGSAIMNFAEAVVKQPDSIAVAYLCGYAQAYDGRMFLLPATANLQRETDVLTQGIVARVLTNAVTRSGARAGLVLMDSILAPNSAAALPLAALVAQAGQGNAGVAASQFKIAPHDETTPVARAIVSGLSAPSVEARALLRDLRATLPDSPQMTLAVREPAEPAWLAGGPPPAPEPQPPVAANSVPPTAERPPVAAPNPDPAPIQAVAPPVAAWPGEPAVLNPAELRRVQLALQRLGYYAGKVDGVVGPDTLAAIRRFQNEMRTEMTGRLTKDQAEKLLATGQ